MYNDTRELIKFLLNTVDEKIVVNDVSLSCSVITYYYQIKYIR